MAADIQTNVSDSRTVAKNLILIELLKKPLQFEEIIEKLRGKFSRGTVNKYLRESFDLDNTVEFQPSNSFGSRRPYQIVPSRRKQVEEKIKVYNKKQEIQNLLDLATAEELNEITRFLFELPFLYSGSENPEPYFPYWNKSTLTKKINRMSLILSKLKARKRIKKLGDIRAPKQVVEIGNNVLNDQKVSQTQKTLFNLYPIDANEAQSTLNYLKIIQDGQTIYQALFKQDPNVAESLAKRCGELLGRSPVKLST
jgi:hypothetical protein